MSLDVRVRPPPNALTGCGAMAAHLLWEQGAGGSSPSIQTNDHVAAAQWTSTCLLSRSVLVRVQPATQWKRSGWIRGTPAKRVAGRPVACSSHAVSALEGTAKWLATGVEYRGVATRGFDSSTFLQAPSVSRLGTLAFQAGRAGSTPARSTKPHWSSGKTPPSQGGDRRVGAGMGCFIPGSCRRRVATVNRVGQVRHLGSEPWHAG
jgi:hypothetical protein